MRKLSTPPWWVRRALRLDFVVPEIALCVVALLSDYIVERASLAQYCIDGSAAILGAWFLAALRHPVQLPDELLEATQSKVSDKAMNWSWKPDAPNSVEPSNPPFHGHSR
jgi:hypothetical protein